MTTPPPDFSPKLTPAQMLELGVFEGKYLNSTRDEYPASWFKRARLSDKPDPLRNLFRVKSRQPLRIWREKGWINQADPFGWFQWFCRFTQGRRIDDDVRQIKRHRAFVRHAAQVRINGNRDVTKRVIQRQALLQWSHDPFPDFESVAGESTFDKIRRIMREAVK